MASTDLVIAAAPVAARGAVLRLLFARFPLDEQEQRVRETEQAVAAGRVSLDGLLAAWQGTELVGAGLLVPQPDGVTMVWPPTVSGPDADLPAIHGALLVEVARRLDASDAKVAQMLFDPAEIVDLDPYRRHGFVQQTDLFFLARTLEPPLPELPLSPLVNEGYQERINEDRFAATLLATYVGSHDCTLLDGLRDGAETLAGHRLSGVWDAALWRIYQVEGMDAAILLLNEHPDQDAVELVYFGVCPTFRGRGYGQRILTDALALAASRGRAVLFLAVDAQNHYAHRVYEALGFAEMARRRALFRFPGGSARE